MLNVALLFVFVSKISRGSPKDGGWPPFLSCAPKVRPPPAAGVALNDLDVCLFDVLHKRGQAIVCQHVVRHRLDDVWRCGADIRADFRTFRHVVGIAD